MTTDSPRLETMHAPLRVSLRHFLVENSAPGGHPLHHPREFVGEIFIGGSNKATVLRAVTEDYLRRSEPSHPFASVMTTSWTAG
jgi:hypothetical protein